MMSMTATKFNLIYARVRGANLCIIALITFLSVGCGLLKPRDSSKSSRGASAPTISSISPNSSLPEGGVLVTLSGTGFQPGAVVTIGGTPVGSALVISDTKITAVADSGTIGAKDVIVKNTDGQSAKLAGGFTYKNVPAIYLAGYFDRVGSDIIRTQGLVQINSDGSVNNNFNVGTGTDKFIYSTLRQTDGKILIGGLFDSYNGTSRSNIARLNTDGSLDTGFLQVGSGLNSTVATIATQVDGKILAGGFFTKYGDVSASSIARLNADGSLDPSFSIGSGFNSEVRSIAIQSNGKIIVGGLFTTYGGTPTGRIVRLNNDGSLDASFNSGAGFDGDVYSIVVADDGKLLVGGNFDSYNGTSTPKLARLNSNGSLDVNFSVGTGFNGWISELTFFNNKILVVGAFSKYQDITMRGMALLIDNGSADPAFDSSRDLSGSIYSIATDGTDIIVGGKFSKISGEMCSSLAIVSSTGKLQKCLTSGEGLNGYVISLTTLTSGQYLVAGMFASMGGSSRKKFAALDAQGNLDEKSGMRPDFDGPIASIATDQHSNILIGGAFTNSGLGTGRNIAHFASGNKREEFNKNVSCSSIVHDIAAQGELGIILAGNFTECNGSIVNRIARLTPKGSLDSSFNVGSGFDKIVRTVSIQTDRKIIIGGDFSNYNGTPRTKIARLNVDGTLDPSFAPEGVGFDGLVKDVSLQDDGKIIVGGDFTNYNGISKKYIARLNSDGTLDTSFNIGAGFDNGVRVVSVSDGKILVGGSFTSYDGVQRGKIARLNSDGTLDQTFATPGAGFNDLVASIVSLADGKYLVGGWFTSYNSAQKNYLARLNADGSLDTEYKVSTNGQVVNILINK